MAVDGRAVGAHLNGGVVRVVWGGVGRWHFSEDLLFPSLADSCAVGIGVAECSSVDLKVGVELEKLKPVIQRTDTGEKKICAS